MSTKSAQLVEKRFIKDFNHVLISLNISPKPNSQIDFEKFIEFVAIFIFHSKDKASFLSESDEVKELWNILKGNQIGYTLKHSLQTVIGAIIGINAKWMFINEVTGKESTIKSFNSQENPDVPILKIGLFASELFFFNNQQE